MRKIIMMALPIMLCAAVSQAQNISGNVKDEQGKALSGATITLKKVKDSAGESDLPNTADVTDLRPFVAFAFVF